MPNVSMITEVAAIGIAGFRGIVAVADGITAATKAGIKTTAEDAVGKAVSRRKLDEPGACPAGLEGIT